MQDKFNQVLIGVWSAALALYLILYGATLESQQVNSSSGGGMLVIPGARLEHRTPYPEWVHGHWIRLDRSHANTESVLRIVDAYLTRHIPVRVVVIDYGWAVRGTWKLDKVRFPDMSMPDGKSLTVIEALRSMGIRVVLDANPLIEDDCDDFDMASKKGWLLKPVKDTSGGESPGLVSWDDESGAKPVRGALLDLTNPAALSWFKDRIRRMVTTLKIDGIKNDAVDALFHALGRDTNGAIGANGFVPVRNWSKAYYWTFFDTARENGTQFDRVTVFRPVDSLFGTHYQTFGMTDISFATWIGNHPPTFAGLRASFMNMIHSSYRGFLNFGASVGGAVGKDVARLSEASTTLQEAVLTSIKRRELLLRWAAVGALLPFFENGGHEGVHAPWRVGCTEETRKSSNDETTFAVKCAPRASISLVERGYRSSVLLHRALVPYFHNTATQAFYHPDMHIWAPTHATAELHSHETRNLTWSPDAARPHPPFFPIVRDVSYAEPDEFTFLAGRDILVVPIVQSIFDGATRNAAEAVVKERISQLPQGSHSVELHDVDDILREATEAASAEYKSNPLASTLANFPPGAVWMDVSRDSADDIVGDTNLRLPMPPIDAGPLIYLRAGAIIPLGIESGMATIRSQRSLPSNVPVGTRVSTTLLGSIKFKIPQRGWHGKHVDTKPESCEPLVLLIPSPERALQPSDQLTLYGEHDHGLVVTRNVTKRSDGTYLLTVRFTAYHRPLLIVVKGVRCIRCAAPIGFDLVDPSRLESIIDSGVEHRAASAFIREPKGEFAVLEPFTAMGGEIVLGPFA